MLEVEAGRLSPERLTDLKERFARHLFLHDLVRFGDYHLNIHRDHPEAPLSPVYLEIRSIRSLFNTKKIAVGLMQQAVGDLDFFLLADVPTAVTPLVSTLSDRLGISHITPRSDKGQIDGLVEKMMRGRIAVLFEDVISGGGSIFRALELLEKFTIKVKDIFVFIDRQHGGGELLGGKGYNLHTIMTLSQLLDFGLREGRVSADVYNQTNEKLAELTAFYKSTRISA